MRLLPALVCGLLLVMVSGCSSSNSADGGEAASTSSAQPKQSPSSTPQSPSATPATSQCPPTPLDVVITYELTTTSSGAVAVEADTNLPEGAELMASFFIEGGFFAQDEAKVQNGHASFGPFSDQGVALQGTYDFSITLPIARNQPPSVQTCIGEAGEYLTGSLVSVEDITGDRFASVDVPVTLP